MTKKNQIKKQCVENKNNNWLSLKTIIINSLNEPENNTSWQRDSLRIGECDPKRKSENAGAEDLRGLVSAASPIKKNQEKVKNKTIYTYIWIV